MFQAQFPFPSAAAEAASRILFVEDDATISQLLTEFLEENGFAAAAVNSAAEMDLRLAQGDVDLIVLDVMLPGEDGLSICRRLRAASSVPIIMLTARGDDVDRIIGLELGADDYVTKPFNSRELVARIRALLRRSRAPFTGPRLRALQFCGWRLYPGERRLLSPDSAKVTMTSAEFDLLYAFCQNPGRILSREQLLDLTHGGLAGRSNGRSTSMSVACGRRSKPIRAILS